MMLVVHLGSVWSQTSREDIAMDDYASSSSDLSNDMY